jgi:hypothetical protein
MQNSRASQKLAGSRVPSCASEELRTQLAHLLIILLPLTQAGTHELGAQTCMEDCFYALSFFSGWCSMEFMHQRLWLMIVRTSVQVNEIAPLSKTFVVDGAQSLEWMLRNARVCECLLNKL